MTQEPVREREQAQLPFTARLYAALPISPIYVGVSIAAVLIALLIVSDWALGRFVLMADDSIPYNPIRDLRIAVVHCLLVAFTPTAYVVLIHRTRLTWRELQGLLGLSIPELDVALQGVGRRSAWQTTWVLALGLGLWLIATYSTTPDDPFDPATISPEVVWHRALGPILIGYTTLLVVTIVSASWSLSAASRRIASLDLLDRDQIVPFKAQALTHSLLILGAAACASPLGFETDLLGLFVSIWIFASVVAGVGLLLPLVGLRRLIRSQRGREVEWCDAELRDARDGLKGGTNESPAGRFAELFAYRQRLEEVSEWPLDAPSFVRFSLYLLIPLGSWLGGALVERVVDTVVR